MRRLLFSAAILVLALPSSAWGERESRGGSSKEPKVVVLANTLNVKEGEVLLRVENVKRLDRTTQKGQAYLLCDQWKKERDPRMGCPQFLFDADAEASLDLGAVDSIFGEPRLDRSGRFMVEGPIPELCVVIGALGWSKCSPLPELRYLIAGVRAETLVAVGRLPEAAAMYRRAARMAEPYKNGGDWSSSYTNQALEIERGLEAREKENEAQKAIEAKRWAERRKVEGVAAQERKRLAAAERERLRMAPERSLVKLVGELANTTRSAFLSGCKTRRGNVRERGGQYICAFQEEGRDYTLSVAFRPGAKLPYIAHAGLEGGSTSTLDEIVADVSGLVSIKGGRRAYWVIIGGREYDLIPASANGFAVLQAELTRQ
jgi:hypothetical protein